MPDRSPRRVTKDDGSLFGYVDVPAWYTAAELLQAEGIAYDLVYQHVFSANNRFGLPPGHRGPMIHFNRGKHVNVASLNTITQTLLVIERPDHLGGVGIAIVDGTAAVTLDGGKSP